VRGARPRGRRDTASGRRAARSRPGAGGAHRSRTGRLRGSGSGPGNPVGPRAEAAPVAAAAAGAVGAVGAAPEDVPAAGVRAAGARPGGFRRRAGLPLSGRAREIGGFALAGGAAYAADLGLFVWLRGPGGMGPLTAKALSFVAGCTVAYLGNALGTYRGRRPAGGRARRYGVFFAVNFAGALMQLACLGFSHYVLGLTTPGDDVVSGAGVGMLLATALRFWGTRTLVFRAPGRESGREPGRESGPASPGGPDGAPGSEPGPAGRPRGRTAVHPEAGAPGSAGVPGAGEGSRPTWTG
jgi:putative flippase GtrA